MAFKLIFFVTFIIIGSTIKVHGTSYEAQTCIDLCASCNGIAIFKNDQCICNIEEHYLNDSECVNLMNQKAEDLGVDFVTCNQSDQRRTRCTVGSKHQFTEKDIENVASYFMQDGPVVGSSIFTGPGYRDRVANTMQSNCDESSLITQPEETMQSLNDYDNSYDQDQTVSSPSDNCLGSAQQVSNFSPQSSGLNYSPQGNENFGVSRPNTRIGSPNVGSTQVSNQNPQQIVSNSNSGYTGSSRIITQPQYTQSPQGNENFGVLRPITRVGSPNVGSTQVSSQNPQQIFSNPNSGCVGSSQIITQPQYTLSPQGNENFGVPRPSTRIGSPNVGSTQVSNQNPQQIVSNPNSGYAGTSQIITQPQYTVPAETGVNFGPSVPNTNIGRPNVGSVKVSNPKVGSTKVASPKVGKTKVASPKVGSTKTANSLLKNPNIESSNRSPILGNPKAENPQILSTSNCAPTVGQASPTVESSNTSPLIGAPNLTPLITQLLGAHLGQPMLGIPAAISQVGNTPGVGELIGAPAAILKAFLAQFQDGSSVSAVKSPIVEQSFAQELNNENPTVGSHVPNNIDDSNNDDCNPTVGSTNLQSSSSSSSYINPIISYPAISLSNPTVGAATPTSFSFVNPSVGASVPTHLSVMNPTVGASTPMIVSHTVHNPLTGSPASYLTHVPLTSYIVSSPIGLPYLSNYNSVSTPNTGKNVENSPFEQTLGQSNPSSKILKQPKKICKKSVAEAVSTKKTRSIESISDIQSNIEEQINLNIASEKLERNQIRKTETEIPKIDRTTTQSPIKNKPIEQKLKIKNFFNNIKKQKNNDKISHGSKDITSTIDMSTELISTIKPLVEKEVSSKNLNLKS